jgi:hypothetical protein
LFLEQLHRKRIDLSDRLIQDGHMQMDIEVFEKFAVIRFDPPAP